MSPSLHRAEDVAVEIKTRALTCTVAQGAETNLGRKVFQGRRRIDDSMVPCVTIIEADDVPNRTRVRDEYEIAQRYVLFAYVPCDPDDPNLAAHAALRDLKRALFLTNGQGDVRWGDKVKQVEYIGRDIGPRADGASFVVCALEVVITYVERLSAP